jgi:hypothetical protein
MTVSVNIPCKFVTKFNQCSKKKKFLWLFTQSCNWPNCGLFESKLSKKLSYKSIPPCKPIPPKSRQIREGSDKPQ